jgi:hypothetical protein
MFSKLCISVNLAASLLQQPSATEQIDYTTVMLNPRADVV